LRKEFGKPIRTLKRELQNATQETDETMREFFIRVKTFSRQVQADMDEEEVCGYIVDGLKPEFRKRLNLLNNNTLQTLKDNIDREEYNAKVEKEKKNKDELTNEVKNIKEQVEKMMSQKQEKNDSGEIDEKNK